MELRDAHLHKLLRQFVVRRGLRPEQASVAIYHLSAKIVSRGKGRSVCAAAAYRAGERIIDPLTGETHDYRRRHDVLHTEILAPEGAEMLTATRAGLWRRVEMIETRSNARLAREFEIALPRELTTEQQIALVRDWAEQNLVSRGMIADVAIHSPHRDQGEENPHAHILTTTREIVGGRFGDKVREWDRKEMLCELRESWAFAANHALEMANHPERIDHRSHRDRGIDYAPTKHLGPDAAELERRGIATTVGDWNRAAAAEREVSLELATLLAEQINLTPFERQLDRIRADVRRDREEEIINEINMSNDRGMDIGMGW